MLLTKHENETFINQTVYISGQAFINCTFTACTLVLRETIYHLERCAFERCNWHVDWVLMWGSPESLREIKALVSMIEQSQAQTQPQQPSVPGIPGLDQPLTGGGLNIPNLTGSMSGSST
jgi:hypothetical protein